MCGFKLYFLLTSFSLSSLFCSMRKDVFDNLVTFKVIIESALNDTGQYCKVIGKYIKIVYLQLSLLFSNFEGE